MSLVRGAPTECIGLGVSKLRGIMDLPLEIMQNIYQHLNIRQYQALRATASHFRAMPEIPVLSLTAFKESVEYIADKNYQNDFHRDEILAGWRNYTFVGDARAKFLSRVKKLKLKQVASQECFDLMAEYCLTDEMVLFLEAGWIGKINPNSFEFSALFHACGAGDIHLFQLLIADSRVDVATDDNRAIEIASENGRDEIVKMLLDDQRVDPTSSNNYSIRSSSENGHDKVVKLLLDDKRADPGAEDNYAICMASAEGHVKVVELLLQDERVNPAAECNCSIISASRNGHLEVVKLLLKDPRVDPTERDDVNMIGSAINEALKYRHREIVDLLQRQQLPRIVF